MMSSSKILFQLQLILCFFLYLHARPAICFGDKLSSCKIDKIYQLGDSISDTGNRMVEDPLDACASLPYGQNFPQGPTGRCSNGMLMIDNIALAAGIPLLNPYLKGNANFTHGVNFAVGGSTALSEHALAEKDIMLFDTTSTLGIQLEWMSTYFASQCNTDINRLCPGNLEHALFMVGETGGNDYNFALAQGKSVEETKKLVPEIVEIIKDAVRKVIDLGASRIIVPGNFPLGCFPLCLRMFESDMESAYDEHGCLKDFNDLAAFHNQYLEQAIITLQEENPGTAIVYGDYYNAFTWLLYNAPHLGIDAKTALEPCCRSGGIDGEGPPVSVGCGSLNAQVCLYPDQHISWDGIHLTQKAYSVLSKWLLADITPKLNCALPVADH